MERRSIVTEHSSKDALELTQSINRIKNLLVYHCPTIGETIALSQVIDSLVAARAQIRKEALREAAESCERRANQWAKYGPNATSASKDTHAEFINEAMMIRALADLEKPAGGG
jgi:hypothetical protein